MEPIAHFICEVLLWSIYCGGKYGLSFFHVYILELWYVIPSEKFFSEAAILQIHSVVMSQAKEISSQSYPRLTFVDFCIEISGPQFIWAGFDFILVSA